MVDELVNVLNRLKENLNSLLDTALSKQRALISLNYEELENAILVEERVLGLIRECEQARTNMLDQFYNKHSLEHVTYKISELCDTITSLADESEIKKLRIIEKQIKATISEIDRINHQNIYIIEHSRGFIKETISSLINANKSFLDKRV